MIQRTTIITPLYHGTRCEDLRRFDHGYCRTADDFYLSPDFETAAYYGPWVYTCAVTATKVGDVDEMIRELAEDAYHFGTSVRFRADKYGAFEVPAERADFQRVFLSVVPMRPSSVEGMDEYDLLELAKRRHVYRAVLAAFNKHLPERNEEAVWAEHAYHNEPQTFYLNYQNDIVAAAWGRGYDVLYMADSSSTGESTSVVVRHADQIRVLSRTAAS